MTSSSSPSSSSVDATAPSVSFAPDGSDPNAAIGSLAATPSRSVTTGSLGGLDDSAPMSGATSLADGSAAVSRSAGPKLRIKEVTTELLDACRVIYGAGTFACLKAKVPGGSGCPTQHKSKAGQLEIQLGDLLVVEMRNEVPTRAATALVMKDGVRKVGAARLHEWQSDPVGMEEWTARFLQVDPDGGYDGGETVMAAPQAVAPVLATPGKAKSMRDSELSGPTRFELLSDADVNALKSRSPAVWLETLSKTIEDGAGLSEEMNSLASAVSSDLTLMGQRLDTVQQALGAPTRRVMMAGKTVYEVLDKLVVASPLEQLEQPDGLEEATAVAQQALELAQKIDASAPLVFARQLLAKGVTVESQVAANAAGHRALEMHTSAATHLMSFLQGFKTDMDRRIESVKAQIPSQLPSPTLVSDWSGLLQPQRHSDEVLDQLKASQRKIDDLERRLGDLQNQVAQTSGDGVQLGSFIFGSFRDVVAWVERYLKADDYGFGPFMDCFTCAEFMCDDEITAETVGTKIKTANGAGFHSLAEARILASFRNGLPTVFSGGKASTSGAPLPKLDKSTKWEDPKRFDSGLRHALSKFMGTKLNRIIEPLISEMTEPEARNLANLMLSRSTRFWTLFIDHLSKTQVDLTLRIGLKVEEAWTFATSEAKRILGDCNDPRFSAHDAGAKLKSNHAHVAATVLYALLKCHMVMNEFMEVNFKDHASVGSERIKLLFNNMSAKNSATDSDAAAKAQAAVEKASTAVQGFQSRFDSLSTRVEKLDMELAKKADK